MADFIDRTVGERRTLVTNSATTVTPTDRVRWGPILAGLFAALSTLALLGVLGVAIGLTAYDAGDPGTRFGIGAGIWGMISALLAFGVGGWVAARTAAVRGESNGMINGAMVWAVAIPVMLFMAAGGMASMMGPASEMATDPAPQVMGYAQPPADTGISGQTVDDVTTGAAWSAWGTLIALLLGLGAAAGGGYLGARELPDVTNRPINPDLA